MMCCSTVLALRIPPKQKCDDKLLETSFLESVSRARKGTVLIVGANVGNNINDPIWSRLMSNETSHIHKVFVEPMPGLFKQLQHNIENMSHAKAVQAAVANTSGTMKLYCLGINQNGNITHAAEQTHRQAWWWNQICSLNRDRLSSQVNITKHGPIPDFASLVTEMDVPTKTFQTLLKESVPDPVLYLQIDVESLDDTLLYSYPLDGDAATWPKVITFEWVLLGGNRTQAAIKYLNDHHYKTCYLGTQNIIGVHDGK